MGGWGLGGRGLGGGGDGGRGEGGGGEGLGGGGGLRQSGMAMSFLPSAPAASQGSDSPTCKHRLHGASVGTLH